MTDEEIAARSGLSVSRVQEIYWSRTWDDITVGEVRKFMLACGVDFDSHQRMKTLSNALRPGYKMAYLGKSKHHELFKRLIKFLYE